MINLWNISIRNLRNRSVLFLKFKLNKSFDIFLHFYIETIVFLMNLKNFQHHCARFWSVLKDPARWLSNRAMKIPPVSMVNRGFAKNFSQQTKERDRDRVNIIIIRHYSSFILPFSRNFSRNITQNKRWNFF